MTRTRPYPHTPMKELDLGRLRTYPLSSRPGKVNSAQVGRPLPAGSSVADFARSLPRLLAAESLRMAAAAIARARREGRGVLLGMGAHPVKTGLGPLIADAIEGGIVTGIACNGACIIHDFEMAMHGSTSEDVGAALDEGRFGMAEDTALFLNGAISEGAARGEGIGAAVGRLICEKRLPNAASSVFAAAHRASIPATVHVALGTDIIHMHPSCDGAATGLSSLRDFGLFASQVAALDGGVYVNLGSAVILPEVFLKAYSLARNLGHEVEGLTTVNMDFILHYRPRVNVLERPTASSGKGYSLTGPHEILLPLLLSLVKEEIR